MKGTITFTLEDETKLFKHCKDLNSSLHEALCQAIHNGGLDGLEWLNRYVDNIKTSYLT
jgi:hypothetical protein